MALLNTFDLPEGNITEANYEETLHILNSTSPGIIQGLELQTCDMQKLLSEVYGTNNFTFSGANN